MAQSIRNIITDLNSAIAAKFNNAMFYGVATSLDREGKLQPTVNERPVTFDDSYGIQVYHKLGNITIKYAPGMGRTNNTINTFAVSAIVFNNERKTGLKSDEIAMVMQSVLTLQNNVLPASIILNSEAIWQTEYRGTPYALNEYASLFQINYTVEMTFKSGCFDLCPEEFSQCKIN